MSDADYSREYQDEYQRLWHEAAATLRRYELFVQRIAAGDYSGFNGSVRAAQKFVTKETDLHSSPPSTQQVDP